MCDAQLMAATRGVFMQLLREVELGFITKFLDAVRVRTMRAWLKYIINYMVRVGPAETLYRMK